MLCKCADALFLRKELIIMAKFDIKKLTALTAAAAVMSSLTGCGQNTTWAADIDGSQIPAGVFIYYLQGAYYDAQEKLSEETAASTPEGTEGTAETAAPDLFSTSIEGMDAKAWIYNEATKQMQEYAAVEAGFDRYGLSLTDEEKASAESYCKQMWDYGGEYFTELGISESSYKSIYLNNNKRTKLFEALYSEGGEQGVSMAELQTYLEDNYALVNYIKMELRDGEGNLLKSEGKAERMAMAESYIERYKNGEDFDVLRVEYENYYNDLVAEAQAAAAEAAENEANTEGDGEGLTIDVDSLPAEAPGDENEEDIAEADDGADETADEAEAETAEEGIDGEAADTEAADNEAVPADAAVEIDAQETAPAADGEAAQAVTETSGEESSEGTADGTASESDTGGDETVESAKNVIAKNESTPCQDVVDAVFGEMAAGDIKIVETQDGEFYYVVLKMDIMEKDGEYLELSKNSLLFEMKDEDYDALIDTWVSAQNISKNQAAYDRYDPKKMFAE